MEHRRWHAAYPPGLATEIELPPGETLAAMLERSIANFAQRTAVTAGAESLSYAELGALSGRLAAHLARAGLRQGDRVALMLPNGLAFPIAMTAILRSGLVGVPVNPLYTPRELLHQLADAGVRCIVLAESLREALEGVILEAGVEQILTAPAAGLMAAIAAEGGAADDPKQVMPLATAIAQAGDSPAPTVQIATADPAFLQYTGGTTGLSKGAVLTHRSVGAGVLQSLSWMRLAVDTRAWSVVAPLPLYHIYPLQVSLITFQLGGVMRLVANPRDPGAVIAEMKRAPFLVFIGVNTLFNALVNAPELSTVDFSGTGLVIGAGASIQQAVSQRWHAAGGPPITEAYGLTETSPSATFNPPGRNGSIGIPVPSATGRRTAAQGSAAVRWLLEARGGNSQGADRGGLLSHRRRGGGRRQRRHDHRRPQEGHDPGVGLQRLPERDRAGGRHAPRRARGRGDRRARRALGRGAEDLRREARPAAHRARPPRALQEGAHRLQAAEVRRVPHRIAEEQCRQDFEARAEGLSAGAIR